MNPLKVSSLMRSWIQEIMSLMLKSSSTLLLCYIEVRLYCVMRPEQGNSAHGTGYDLLWHMHLYAIGHVSASAAQMKLTITSRQGEHDPQACEQSGKLDPATSTVSGLLSLTCPLSWYKFSFAASPFTGLGCVDWWWWLWSETWKKKVYLFKVLQVTNWSIV